MHYCVTLSSHCISIGAPPSRAESGVVIVIIRERAWRLEVEVDEMIIAGVAK